MINIMLKSQSQCCWFSSEVWLTTKIMSFMEEMKNTWTYSRSHSNICVELFEESLNLFV